MAFSPDRPARKSPRLKEYNYALDGAYFVTICTQNRTHLFGEVVGDEMRLNDCGEIVQACWTGIPIHFPHVELDAFVVMPNHVHGILVVCRTPATVGATHASPLHTSGPKPGSISAIVGSFKSAAAQQINSQQNTVVSPIWQRSFHDHIIRDERELNILREYVRCNPAQWAEDRYYKANP